MSETEEIERSVRAALEELGVYPSNLSGGPCGPPNPLARTFEILPCDPELADTAAFCAHYGIPPGESGNTIVVATKKEPKTYAACLVLATTRLDVNHAVRRLLGGQKLSFASGEETRALTGMMMGGVTVFGLPPGLPLFIDSAVLGARSIVVGGGSRSCKIRIAPEILRRIPNAAVIDGLAREVVGDGSLPPTTYHLPPTGR